MSTGPVSGTPVLLLHGWGESRRSFDRLLPLLPVTIHGIAMDQRGHGNSGKPKVGYSLRHFAEDIVTFMDAMGISSAVLVGSSSGGYVAQQVALTSPHRVAGLVLVGSPRDLQGRPSFAAEIDQLTDPMDAAWVKESLTWFPRFHQVPQWYIDDRVRDGVRVPAHVWRDTFNGLITARPPPAQERSRHPPSSFGVITTSCWRRRRRKPSLRPSPASRLVIYEDTGHLVLWEQPERVASDLITFIERLPAGTPDER